MPFDYTLDFAHIDFREHPELYCIGKEGQEILPREEDPVKAESARIFYARWREAREDRKYLELMEKHREKHER